MKSKAKELVDKIIRDLRQKNFESAKESKTSLMDLLLETKNQDPAVEKEVVNYMKRKLERLVGNQRSLDLREDQKKMMDNFIADITGLYYIDISEALNKAKTKDLLGGLWDEMMGRDEVKSDLEQITVKKPKEVQPEIEAPQEVRPTQDNPPSQEPPTGNEQYNQALIDEILKQKVNTETIMAARLLKVARKEDRDSVKEQLLSNLERCNDLDTLKDVKDNLKSRMNQKDVWAKIMACMGRSKTGNILKTVNTKIETKMRELKELKSDFSERNRKEAGGNQKARKNTI